tara:strand:+ start:1636 stop:2169 length:534 start_codon:yes stop_codon:yes gene_type:complete
LSVTNLLFKHPAYFIGLGFGSGLSRLAPGTVGTLWAWALFLIFRNLFTFNFAIIFLLFSFFLGIWACSLTSKKLKKNDPSEIVIDEIVAFWLVLVLLPSLNDPMGGVVLAGLSEWFIQFFAFIFFRVFDIFKPVPISWVDKNIKGGFGIMFDDIIAAGYTLLLVSFFLKVYALIAFI